MDLPHDTNPDTLKLRLDAARSAQERTRLAFLTVTVISFAMLAAEWNAQLSLYKNVAQEFAALVHLDKDKDANTGVQELQKDFLREYVADRMINISLLGIRVGADDAPILGSIAMIVALFWFYQSVRRENFVIGWLLHDNGKDGVRDTKLRIFHGIISYSIFTRVLHIDEPFIEIDRAPQKQSEGLLQKVTSKIYLLPLYAAYGLLILEGVALATPSPFRPVSQPLALTLLEERPSDLWWPDLWWRLIRFALAAVLVFWLVRGLCRKILKFEESTETILREFYFSIDRNHSQHVSEQQPTDVPIS